MSTHVHRLSVIIMSATGIDLTAGKNICILCCKLFSDNSDQVKVGDKGLQNITENSNERGDANVMDYLLSSSKPAVIYVHGVERFILNQQ